MYCKNLFIFKLVSIWMGRVLAQPLHFDYIIAGGGTSGLTLANRLSEQPNITVAVIEAGDRQQTNPNVTNPGAFTFAFNTPIDWGYTSARQNLGNRTVLYHAGKALGGTSTINGMTYIRAEKDQIDAWEKVGNQGWNWDNLLPYYKKSENFSIPTEAQISAGVTYIQDFHGEAGLLKTGYIYQLLNGSFHDTVNTSWNHLGLPLNPDVNGGHMRGFNVWPGTVNRELYLREDAATAYYYPFQNRSNLFVFLNTTVDRITWKNGTASKAVAEGVEVRSSIGTTYTISARKEVIISAGSLRSPAILEHSGVGNPNVLNMFGIPVKVALPGVGENLQDQILNVLAYTTRTNTTYFGEAPYVTYGNVLDYFHNASSAIVASANSSIKDWAATISQANNNSISASALESLLRIQCDLVFNKKISTAEILTTASSQQLLSPFWGLLPFSRGSIHISSANPTSFPTIDPKFGLLEIDVKVQIAIARLIRDFWDTEPVKGLGTIEITPGFDVVPRNATDKEWIEWLSSSYNPNYHPVGTAAMMAKELGGVLDENMRVYGTKNVRVVDASVLPFQTSGHLTSTLYAVTERLADIIKCGHDM